MQMKKILAAGSIAALMAGSTIAAAATLGDYPSPFVSGSQVQSLVVVGATAAPDDVVGAVDIAARLGGSVTRNVSVTGAAGTVSVSGGVMLDTANTKLRLGDSLTGARDTLTKDDLSTTLATGSVVDTQGTEYKYDQYISVGSTAKVGYDRRTTGGLNAPDGIVDISTTDSSSTATTSAFYSTKVIFNKDLDVQNTSVGGTSTKVDGKPLKIFGNDYTLGSGTSELSATKLTLYGGGTEVSLDWTGASVTQSITVSGKTVSVTLSGITTNNEAALIIDGTSYTQLSGTYITTSSGVRIYVKTVNRFGQGNTGNVVLKVGADKIILQNANAVKTGTAEETVKGTYVRITSGSGAASISQVQVDVFKPDSTSNFIKAGSSFTDPVFKTFSVAFNGFSPSLDSTARDSMTVGTSSDNYATVTFNDYRGYAKTLTFGNNYYSSTSNAAARLMDSSYTYNVDESKAVALNNYTIINQGGFSHVLQVTNFDTTSTTKTVTVKDVVTGTEYQVTVTGNGLEGTKVIDGKTYLFNVSENTNTSVIIHKGSVNRTGGATDPIALYTPLKLKNGQELVLTKPIVVTAGMNYTLPGNNTVTSGEGLCTKQIVNATGTTDIANTTFLCGTVNYTLTNDTNGVTLFPTGMNLTGNTDSVGLVIIEEKDASNIRNHAKIAVDTYSSGSTYKIRVGATDTATILSGEQTVLNTNTANKETDSSYVTKGLDLYGTLASRNSQEQGSVTLSYPDDQIVAIAAVGANPVFSVSGASVGTTVQQAVPIKTALGKLDTEITTEIKSTTNLVLVGGPAVNSLVRELATGGKTKNTTWYVQNGRGTAIVNLVENAFTSGKSALVVAGHSAADTRTASSWVQGYDSHSADFAGKTLVVLKDGVLNTQIV